METYEVEVKAKGAVVDTVTVPRYATVEEAREQEGEEDCLSLINRQKKTDIANEARTATTSEVTLNKNTLAKVFAVATADEFVQIQTALNAANDSGDDSTCIEIIKGVLERSA